MKTGTSDDCYGYMRLTHALALFWGLPITRIRTNNDDEQDRDTVVQGHRYTFDRRVTPVWLAYAAVNAFVAYYNYRQAVNYAGRSFKACFEESYCVAVLELANRNVGPCATLACLLLYGRGHKAVALAGTERTLAFLRDTDDADDADGGGGGGGGGGGANRGRGHGRPSPAVRYCSAAVLAAYWACIWLYAAAVPAAVVAPYCLNALTQTAVYHLVLFQYYVLERGYARVNRLLETVDVPGCGGGDGGGCGCGGVTAGDAARWPVRSLARLADAHDDLGRLVGHLNRAYTVALMAKWPYSVVRLVLVVFRVIELWAAARAGSPFARVAAVLIVEHAGEVLLFLVQLTCFCVLGDRLTEQAERTSASLQKLKLNHMRFHLDVEIKKMINIFWVRVNARKVNVTVGGFIIVNMNFMKAVCGVIATYFLILIQFERQKGESKPYYHVWN